MRTIRLGVIMNGVTGRMGTNQHLIRSIQAIRDQGGVALDAGIQIMPDPILVGRNSTTWPVPSAKPQWNRVAFAAAHVVAEPRAEIDPWLDTAIDWEAILAFRHHLWSLGFDVAEAMDTAQRGMGLDWPTSLELIRRSVTDARTVPGAVVFSGAGTDHLPVTADLTIDRVIAAYEEQCAAIEAVGGRIIIGGSAAGHSDALLGIFDAIAPAAAAALSALATGDRAAFKAILAPTVPLSRHIFASPTRFYKTGVVFMAWLNGHQSHFTMVGGQQSARSVMHLCALFRLADAAGLLRDPDRAAARMRCLLAVSGIDD